MCISYRWRQLSPSTSTVVLRPQWFVWKRRTSSRTRKLQMLWVFIVCSYRAMHAIYIVLLVGKMLQMLYRSIWICRWKRILFQLLSTLLIKWKLYKGYAPHVARFLVLFILEDPFSIPQPSNPQPSNPQPSNPQPSNTQPSNSASIHPQKKILKPVLFKATGQRTSKRTAKSRGKKAATEDKPKDYMQIIKTWGSKIVKEVQDKWSVLQNSVSLSNCTA